MHLCAQGQQQLQVAPFQKLLRLTVNYNVKDECRASLWPVLDSSLFFWDGSTYGVLIMVLIVFSFLLSNDFKVWTTMAIENLEFDLTES